MDLEEENHIINVVYLVKMGKVAIFVSLEMGVFNQQVVILTKILIVVIVFRVGNIKTVNINRKIVDIKVEKIEVLVTVIFLIAINNVIIGEENSIIQVINIVLVVVVVVVNIIISLVVNNLVIMVIVVFIFISGNYMNFEMGINFIRTIVIYD